MIVSHALETRSPRFVTFFAPFRNFDRGTIFSCGKCEKPRFEGANRTLRRPYRGKYPHMHPNRGYDPSGSGSSPYLLFQENWSNKACPYLNGEYRGICPYNRRSPIWGTPIGHFHTPICTVLCYSTSMSTVPVREVAVARAAPTSI